MLIKYVAKTRKIYQNYHSQYLHAEQPAQCACKILRDHGESHSEKVCQGSDDWDGQQSAQVHQVKYSHTRISEIEIRMVFCSKVVNVLVSFQADIHSLHILHYCTVVVE